MSKFGVLSFVLSSLLTSQTSIGQTTIIVAAEHDVIYIGADGLLVDDSLRVVTDAACKIGQAAQFYYAAAGVYHSALIYLDLDSVMSNVPNSKQSPTFAVNQAESTFAVLLSQHVQEELRRRHSKDSSEFMRQSHSIIAFGWFENSIAHLRISDFTAFADSGKIFVATQRSECISNCELYSFGIDNFVKPLIADRTVISKLSVPDAIYRLLATQAKATPRVVGGVLRVLRIDSRGHIWVHGDEKCFH